MSSLRRQEDGFTLIEVLVASLILLGGLVALLTTFDRARTETSGSERSAQAVRRAEQELERVLAVKYGSLAENSSAAPATCTQRSAIATSYAPGTAVAAAGAPVTPASTWSVTRMGATSSTRGCVYDFVRWENDPTCPDVDCPGLQDYKRVTVAVSVTNASGGTLPGGPTKPVIVSAVKANPQIASGARKGGSSPCDLVGGCG